MFGLGTTEIMVIAGVIVLIFGVNKLPKLGQGLGQAIRGFRKEIREINDVKDEAQDVVRTVQKDLRA